MRRRSRLAIVLAAATAAAIAVGVFLARGDRHRLYWDPQAGHCWDALEALALSSSSLRPVSITVRRDADDGSSRVDVAYRLDRALAGAVLNAHCIYGEGERHAQAIVVGGTPVDGETLRRINAGEG
ncbi:MAG: hypothetical protein JXB36_17035 [Gammaproteobacteria bacterium]|nr:hypothetical protein [Gammaproteobacteria bacterium]